jgi:hypothetical protein
MVFPTSVGDIFAKFIGNLAFLQLKALGLLLKCGMQHEKMTIANLYPKCGSINKQASARILLRISCYLLILALYKIGGITLRE